MWMLVFSILALILGNDIRQRGLEISGVNVDGSAAHVTGQGVIAIGAWMSLVGGITLNIAVWRLF